MTTAKFCDIVFLMKIENYVAGGTKMEDKTEEVIVEKMSFNGTIPLDLYKLLKMESVRRGINIKNYIVEILSNHAETLRSKFPA